MIELNLVRFDPFIEERFYRASVSIKSLFIIKHYNNIVLNVIITLYYMNAEFQILMHGTCASRFLGSESSPPGTQ